MFVLLTFVFSLVYQGHTQSPLLASYEQLFSTRFVFAGTPAIADWKALPFKNARSLVSFSDGTFQFLAGTSLFLYSAKNNSFTDVTRYHPGLMVGPTSTLVLAQAPTRRVIVGDSTGFFICTAAGGTACKRISIPHGNINAMAHEPVHDRLLIATANGLYVWEASPPYGLVKLVNLVEPVLTVATDPNSGTIAAGTNTFMWRTLTPGDLDSFHFFRTPGIIDATPTAMVFDKLGKLWIGNSICINVQEKNLEFTRWGGFQGLATGNLTSMSIDQLTNDVWAGTQHGIVRFERANEKWHYYYGPRYLPGKSITSGQNVSSIAAFTSPVMLSHVAAITDYGLAVLDFREMTLEQKNQIIEKDIIYFRSPTPEPHPYAGYLVGDVGFHSYGNFSSYIPSSNDNNGLWTSIYLSGECFRYAITKDPKVKENAWKYFEGLEFLNHVTGIKGLMARSVLYGRKPPSEQWRESKTKPGWIWKSDTSSDELVGHMMVYPLVYHLLAETAAEKQRAYVLIDDITRYIVTNGYVLIDWTGRPTTWGHWDPETLNENSTWYDERGINSMQILGWLYSAYAITGDDLYKRAYEDLTHNYGYHVNVINAKITQPDDMNYSDDELMYMSYFPFLFAEDTHHFRVDFNPPLAPYFSTSIARSQRIVGVYRPSPWNAIYYYWKTLFAQREQVEQPEQVEQRIQLLREQRLKSYVPDLADSLLAERSVQTLREWSVSQIHWPVDNSHRLNLYYRHQEDRENLVDVIELVPYDEQPLSRWNTDWYDVSGVQGNGYGASDPGAFSMAYWICRWVGLGV